jgi:hypothetical protein
MKTIINNQQLLRWERELQRLESWLSLLWQHGVYTPVKTSLLVLKNQKLVLAGQDHLVTLIANARALVMASTVNSRVYVGLLLMLVATPLASCSHLLFNQELRNPDWYYRNYYDLFLVIGPYASIFLCLLGVYFYSDYTKKAKALYFPMGMALGKVLWLIQVSSNDEFNSLPSIAFLFYGLMISALLPTVLDHLIWRKFHDFDGKMARIEGLTNVLPMDDKSKSMLVNEIKKARSFKF